jgi:mannosyltransferase OCH1-like enzyme
MISKLNNGIRNRNLKHQKKKQVIDVVNVCNINRNLKIPYPIKQYYNTVIPLKIYQTWHTKNLPPLMSNSVNKIKINNPAFNHYLFDDDDCRNFIKNNFSLEILNAYDTLIPGAYKADLWRYCILYKNGGIYIDIKYEPVNHFKFINLNEKEHWVLDADKNGIYNALMICKPNNPILLKAINKTVQHVNNRYYGNCPLDPTGPTMLAQFFSNAEKNNFDMYHSWVLSFENRYIYFNNYLVFKSYKGYLDEYNHNKKSEYYSSLWSARKIYK